MKVTEVTTQLNSFRTVTQVWIHILWRNDAYSLMLLRRGALLFFKVIHRISRSHGSKNLRIWPRLDVSDPDSHIVMKWCIQLDIAYERCPIVFQGHPSNFKVTRLKKYWIWPRLGISGLLLQFEFTNGYKMMHKAWSSIEEVPYCFSRSSVEFQGHTALKIIELDPNWAFLDCNSSLISPMATKWCTKLEAA